MIHRFFILFVCLLALGCQEDRDVGTSGEYLVDSEFEPYVQDFIAEAAKRGQTIDFSDTGLRVEFSNFELGGAGGFCYLDQHHIVINKY